MKTYSVSQQPLPQPVVAHGSFVMNTEEQIASAFADYRARLFRFIPSGNT